ncbi:LD-carboxypeptidase [Rapidithrix thailandica]|uniref:LD-carboxypeptidase n=1 Tax=Rapidithrix thailandica TaxID=413964 RepID=A0AAW9S6V6_9BACT
MTILRRKFLQQLTMAAALAPLGAYATDFPSPSGIQKKPLLPQRLQAGQTIGIVSPSGAVYEKEPYQVAIEALQAMGFQVKLSTSAQGRYGHLAGTDTERAEEINSMFADPDIHGIICLRGGSGAARILDKLDYKTIAKNPKVFVGYSDITALLLAIYTKTGLITFHGPVATSSWNAFSYGYFKRLLMDGETVCLKNPEKKEGELVQTENRIRTIHTGEATGILAGGNLAVLSDLIGTGYLPDWKGKILFLEDIGEEIYRMDRMFSHLKLAGILSELKGFVFGKCTRCSPGKGYGSLTLEEVIDDHIKPLNIPAFSGAMIGHISEKFTIPVGIEARINADKGTIELLQAAVQ